MRNKERAINAVNRFNKGTKNLKDVALYLMNYSINQPIEEIEAATGLTFRQVSDCINRLSDYGFIFDKTLSKQRGKLEAVTLLDCAYGSDDWNNRKTFEKPDIDPLWALCLGMTI